MNETKAARYQRLRRRTQAVGVAAGSVMLAALAVTPAGRSLAAWSRGSGRPAGVVAEAEASAQFVLCAVLLWELVALPAVLYLGLVVDRRFRRGESTLEGLLAAQAQATAVAAAGALAAAAVIGAGSWIAGAFWWLPAGALLVAGRASALALAPAILAIAGGSRPIDRPDLRARLAALAAEARVPVGGIDEWSAGGSAGAAAFVAGLGRTRRVFVSSEITRGWPGDEIAVVVAHELAHHAHHDLWRTLALDGAVLLAALWTSNVVLGLTAAPLRLGGAGDPAAWPLVALVAGGVWVAATPLRHAQSRRHERRADRFALALTGGADAFAAAVRRLAARYLADERPSRLTRWLYYRHPSVAERLAVATAFGAPGPSASAGPNAAARKHDGYADVKSG